MGHRRQVWALAALLAVFACSSGAEQQYREAMRLWNGGEFSEAINRLRVLRRNYPDSPLARRALLKVAQIQAFDLRLYDEAVDTYRLYLRLYPQGTDTERALDELTAVLFEKQRDYLSTINLCQRFLERFPTSERAPLMQKRIVKSYLELRNFEQARIEAKAFLRRYAADPATHEVAYDIVQSYFIAGENDQAVESARAYLTDRPQSPLRARVSFTLAVALEEMDHLEEAKAAYVAARAEYPEPTIVERKILAIENRIARKHREAR